MILQSFEDYVALKTSVFYLNITAFNAAGTIFLRESEND